MGGGDLQDSQKGEEQKNRGGQEGGSGEEKGAEGPEQGKEAEGQEGRDDGTCPGVPLPGEESVNKVGRRQKPEKGRGGGRETGKDEEPQGKKAVEDGIREREDSHEPSGEPMEQ